ncbi:MAG: STAS domain-containing protein [Gammaproteobacteria bacterium]|nr:STAS domain-containing protein [Gammaproteobacteria bacterium]
MGYLLVSWQKVGILARRYEGSLMVAINVRTLPNTNDHIVVTVSGRFTFDVHREFAEVLKTIGHQAKQVTVDLCSTDYMDSAALGMLIQMRSKVAPKAISLRLKQNSMVSEVLTVANFHQLFRVEFA